MAATLLNVYSVLRRTFLFALFFDFLYFLCRGGHNPQSLVVHFIKQRFKLPAWIETERKSLDSLVDAGEMTQEEANDTISEYGEILSNIENGLKIAKRNDFGEEQQFFSLPNAMHTEGFQTVICDENGYQSFGPYETKTELYGALKEYTDEQVAMGSMTQENANEILAKYE